MAYLLLPLLWLLALPAVAHEAYHVDFNGAPATFSIDQTRLQRCQWLFRWRSQQRCFYFRDPDRGLALTFVYPIPRSYPKNDWTVSYALGTQARLRCNGAVVRQGTLKVREDGRRLYLSYQGKIEGRPFDGEVWMDLDGRE